jgi:hypothetical protein
MGMNDNPTRGAQALAAAFDDVIFFTAVPKLLEMLTLKGG